MEVPAGVIQGSKSHKEITMKTQCRFCQPGSDFGESNDRQFILNVFKPSIIWEKMFPGVIHSPEHKEA